MAGVMSAGPPADDAYPWHWLPSREHEWLETLPVDLRLSAYRERHQLDHTRDLQYVIMDGESRQQEIDSSRLRRETRSTAILDVLCGGQVLIGVVTLIRGQHIFETRVNVVMADEVDRWIVDGGDRALLPCSRDEQQHVVDLTRLTEHYGVIGRPRRVTVQRVEVSAAGPMT